MHPEIETAFNDLHQLRDEYFSSPIFINEINKHVAQDKWSVGEVIYHCYLLLKLTRQFTKYYVPIAKHCVAVIPNHSSYNNDMHNIYAGKTMKAPAILNPKLNVEYRLEDLFDLLEAETELLKEQVGLLNDQQVQKIRYPDPVPKYPNVVQVVKLLYIHEKHHYEVVSARNEQYHRD
ncbi:DinB family protein [Macrococcus sp. EM39E]|uniref:DinB family protein n=1 Tax=Macrococcus animalis TaxID=3395467 RepID=UPI0039BE9B6A